MSSVSNNNNYTVNQAYQYLQANIHRPEIRVDLYQLDEAIKIAEIDLAKPLTSEHRKQMLLERITTIINRCNKKPAVNALKTPSQKALDYKNVLLEIKHKLPSWKPIDLHHFLKLQDNTFSDKFYTIVALFCGYYDATQARECFKENFDVLKQGFPAVFDAAGGTILDQLAADFQKEHDLLNAAEIHNAPLEQHLKQMRTQQQVRQFQNFTQNVTSSHKCFRQFYQMLPPAAQQLLPQVPYYGHGFNPDLHKTLGAHFDNTTGQTTFRVYAPNAEKIVLNLSAFQRVEHSLPLVKGTDGVWTAQTPHAQPGRTYHFMVTPKGSNQAVKKLDPFAFGNCIHCEQEYKDDHESQVRDLKSFHWNDQHWMAKRRDTDPAHKPMAIYEVHAPTWRKTGDGKIYNWRQLGVELAQYCKEMGYTHVELMALLEHPLLSSLGYQITSNFAPNSRMGNLDDFKFFVDEMHRNGIGVIVDWAPAHFANNSFGLIKFDGTALFEYDDGRLSEWGTPCYDYKKQITKDFLASILKYYIEECHIDGFRYDAMKNILFGSINKKGYNINLEARSYFRNLNTYLHRQYSGMQLIAEEASAYPNLTQPASVKTFGVRGQDFDSNWLLDFGNKIVEFMKVHPMWRTEKHDVLTSTPKDIDHSEQGKHIRGKQVITLSHDECANGKESLQTKMPFKGDPIANDGAAFARFANGRLFLAYQLLRGGGPILDFMGNELLQSAEWHGRLLESIKPKNEWEKTKACVQWEELDPKVNPTKHHYHKGSQEARKALLHIYQKNPGLWDQTDAGFEWIRGDDKSNNAISFHRRGTGEQFACIFNFSDHDMVGYELPIFDRGLDNLKGVTEMFNTDDKRFGGAGRINSAQIIRDHTGKPTHFKIHLPPCTAILLKENF